MVVPPLRTTTRKGSSSRTTPPLPHQRNKRRLEQSSRRRARLNHNPCYSNPNITWDIYILKIVRTESRLDKIIVDFTMLFLFTTSCYTLLASAPCIKRPLLTMNSSLEGVSKSLPFYCQHTFLEVLQYTVCKCTHHAQGVRPPHCPDCRVHTPLQRGGTLWSLPQRLA